MTRSRTVARFVTVQEADTFQALLAEQGIRSWVNNATVVQMEWIISNAVGGVRLDVADDDYDQAKAIIDDLQRKRTDRRERLRSVRVTAVCEDCGREATFSGDRAGFVENCPHCGAYVDVPELEGADGDTDSPDPSDASPVEE